MMIKSVFAILLLNNKMTDELEDLISHFCFHMKCAFWNNSFDFVSAQIKNDLVLVDNYSRLRKCKQFSNLRFELELLRCNFNLN